VIALIGHCLLSEDNLTLELGLALRTGTVDRLLASPGSCSVVMVRRCGEHVLAADDGGQFPLYTARRGDEIVFGSSASAVASRIGAEVDLLSLAIDVVAPREWELNATRTGFVGVRRLIPGHRLHIDVGGVREVDATIRPDPLRTLDACAEELRTKLQVAVAARFLDDSARISTDFSGGIDSTSLAFLALEHVESLPAITFSHARMAVEDDLAHARRFAWIDPRIRQHHVVGTEENLPYQELRRPVDEPTPAVMAIGVDIAKLAAAKSFGCDTHLVGEGGDLVLTAPHNYLLDLARQRHFDVLWRHCAAWARLRFRSPMGLFKHVLRLAWIGRREGMLRFAASLEAAPASRRQSWEHETVTSWGAPSCDWLAAPARNALVDHLRFTGEEPDRGFGAGDRATMGQLRSANRAYQMQRAVGSELGVRVHAPYLDTEVVRTCLGVESWRKADPAITKKLLSRALAGIVPEEVLTRSTKGDYTRAAHLGLRRAAPRILALLNDSVSADLGLVEPSRVVAAVERAARGLDGDWAPLNHVLGIELWLRARLN
jgi:asparagine synthase (glutamine-hydrolysing)